MSYLPGAAIGLPQAAFPPAGVYFINKFVYEPVTVYQGSGRPLPVKITALAVTPSLFWVADRKILGASYGAYVIIPLLNLSVRSFGNNSSKFGVYNPTISPINLSWQLSPGLFVTPGLTFYLDYSTYGGPHSVHIGSHYWTAEPNFSIAYLSDTWHVDFFSAMDFNTTNNRYGGPFAGLGQHYHSGEIVAADLSVERMFGPLSLGIGGTAAVQIANDTIDGNPVPETTLNGYGNKVGKAGIGPIIGYRLGSTQFTGFYTRDVYRRNYGAGDLFVLRVSFPL